MEALTAEIYFFGSATIGSRKCSEVFGFFRRAPMFNTSTNTEKVIAA
jgi:hypothetical protein